MDGTCLPTQRFPLSVCQLVGFDFPSHLPEIVFLSASAWKNETNSQEYDEHERPGRCGQ